MYSEEEFLQISGIQHFSFCRRQWALIHIEHEWADNILTAEGIIEHNRVHDESICDTRKGIITLRGLRIFSRNIGVSGDCDAVEFIPSEEGISLHGKNGYWKVKPVEYKHGSSKSNDCDRLQLTLQVICLEEMFMCRIDEADIFYFENRRREHVIIDDDLRESARKMVYEMHSYMNRGYTPKVKPGKACNNCSLKDICLPEILKNSESVNDYIDRVLMGECNEKNA